MIANQTKNMKMLWKLWQIPVTRTFNYQRTNLAESCKNNFFFLRLLHCIVSCVSKEIQIILMFFIVIAIYCQASSINHLNSHVAKLAGKEAY